MDLTPTPYGLATQARDSGPAWWACDDPHSKIVADLRRLQADQRQRIEDYQLYLGMYSSRPVAGLSGSQGAGYSTQRQRLRDKLTLNVIEVVIETACSFIATENVRVQYQTSGGTWGEQRLGDQLSRFVDARFSQLGVDRKDEIAFKLAAIFGDGWLHPWLCPVGDSFEVRVDVVYPWEMWFDDDDSKYCSPSVVYMTRDVPRSWLQETFPKAQQVAGAADLMSMDVDILRRSTVDPVTMITAIHLPSHAQASDGRIVRATSAGVLTDDRWTHTSLPLPSCRWIQLPTGVRGKGVSEQLLGLQVEINKILRKVSRHMDLASSHVAIEKGSKVAKSLLTNREFSMIEYTGRAPVFFTVASISPEYFMQLDRLFSRAFEISGLSQLFASGTMPGNLRSGRAQIIHRDTQSRRFRKVQQDYEWMHVDLADWIIRLSKDASEATGQDVAVLSYSQDGSVSERIALSDVMIESDARIARPYPIGFLPQTPEGQMSAIAELADVAPEMRQELLLQLGRYPDLRAAVDTATSGIRLIRKIVDSILYDPIPVDDDGEPAPQYLLIPPDAMIDIMQAMRYARAAYQQAMIEGAPEERLDLLRQYMAMCEDEIRRAEKEAAQVQAQAAAQALPMPAEPPMDGGMA